MSRAEYVTETKIQKSLAKNLRELGYQVLNKVGNFMEGRGWPDLYVVGKDYRGWIELKGHNTPTSNEQYSRAKLLREAGDNVVLLRFVDRRPAKRSRGMRVGGLWEAQLREFDKGEEVLFVHAIEKPWRLNRGETLSIMALIRDSLQGDLSPF